MSQKERVEKRKKKERLRLLLVSFIFIYLFFRSVPSLFAVSSKTTLPESTTIEDNIKTEAIIIKRENLYKAAGDGKIETYIAEGEKVAIGTKIAQLNMLDETSTLKQELDELNKKIDILKKTEKDAQMTKIDEDKIQDGIEEIIYDIQKFVAVGDYEQAEIMKEKLALYYSKQKEILGEGRLIDHSLENLEKCRDRLLQQITNNTINYYSQQSGVVSYRIDGFEEIYSFNNKENYKYSDFKEVSNKYKLNGDGMDVEYGEPVFKIVDNLEWYMFIRIDNIEDISDYEVGDWILISSDKDKEGIKGQIENINKEGKNGTILCKFTTGFDNYYDNRLIDIDLIKYKHEGFKLPSKCIVKKGGVEGVYTKDISGIIKFKPVEILEEDEKFVYISSGDNSNRIKIKGSDKLTKTITKYDEILLNTRNIKEGTIMD